MAFPIRACSVFNGKNEKDTDRLLECADTPELVFIN